MRRPFSFMMLAMLAASPSVAADSSWYVVNDTVMGGVSRSEVFEDASGTITFRGALSLENNGGFTSARTEEIPVDWVGREGLLFRATGDGRTYIATVRTRNPALRRIYYRQTFQTERGKPVDVRLPFLDFEAYAYGQRVPNAPPLTQILEQIGSVGVMLADKQEGPFQLLINDLDTYGNVDETRVEPPVSTTAIATVLQLAVREGVPLFNAGHADRCADVYRTALTSVLFLAPERLDNATVQTLSQTLRVAKQTAEPRERAWILRNAIDWLLNDLEAERDGR